MKNSEPGLARRATCPQEHKEGALSENRKRFGAERQK